VESKSNSTDLDHMITAIFYRRIKHGSFSSLYKGENQGMVIELNVWFSESMKHYGQRFKDFKVLHKY